MKKIKKKRNGYLQIVTDLDVKKSSRTSSWTTIWRG